MTPARPKKPRARIRWAELWREIRDVFTADRQFELLAKHSGPRRLKQLRLVKGKQR